MKFKNELIININSLTYNVQEESFFSRKMKESMKHNSYTLISKSFHKILHNYRNFFKVTIVRNGSKGFRHSFHSCKICGFKTRTVKQFATHLWLITSKYYSQFGPQIKQFR